MTEKNLPYFVTRTSLCIHAIELHLTKAQLYLMQILREMQNAQADTNDGENAKSQDVIEEIRLAKESALTGMSVMDEFYSWFQYNCPPPNEKRNLRQGFDAMDRLCRRKVLLFIDPEAEEVAATDGFNGVIKMEQQKLHLLGKDLGALAQPKFRELLSEAYERRSLHTYAEVYEALREAADRLDEIRILQRTWSDVVLTLWFTKV